MPEGDIVFRVAARIGQALAGRRLIDADLRWPGLSTADLAGVEVRDVTPRGKHLLIRLGTGWTVHSHLKMEGSWHIQATPSGAASRPHPARDIPLTRGRKTVRVVLIGPEWTCLGLQLGLVGLVHTENEHTVVGHLGPDVFDPGFDPDQVVANFQSCDATIGAALLDQRNLAGIGTLWSAETLFCERIHPWAPAATLDPRVLRRIAVRAQRLITVGAKSVTQSSTGEYRTGHERYVHARSGKPCRRCGGTVRVSQIGTAPRQRPMFYCPGCQGGLAPGDDGKPVRPLGAGPRRR